MGVAIVCALLCSGIIYVRFIGQRPTIAQVVHQTIPENANPEIGQHQPDKHVRVQRPDIGNQIGGSDHDRTVADGQRPPSDPKPKNRLPVQVSPADHAIVGAQALRFEWQLDSDSTDYIVVIFEGNDPNNGVDIRQYQVDSPATSLVMPAADRLSPGMYSWSVIGWNTGGGAETDIRTFVVARDADFNLDGRTNGLDIFQYMNAWLAHDPRSDVNGDGSTTLLDLSEFVTAWFEPSDASDSMAR